MSKKDGHGTPQAEQRLPKGHFDSDGLSQGDALGEGRKTHDAYNTVKGGETEGPKERK